MDGEGRDIVTSGSHREKERIGLCMAYKKRQLNLRSIEGQYGKLKQ